MKIAIPENVTNSLRFKVGDLYAAGGNSSNTAFWLVVAITERGGGRRPAPGSRDPTPETAMRPDVGGRWS